MKRYLGIALLALTLGLASIFGTAEAAKKSKKPKPTVITASQWLTARHPVVSGGWQKFIEVAERDSKGTLTFKLFAGGSLLGAEATKDGVRYNTAQMGFVALTDHPKDIPHGQLIADLAMLGTNQHAAAAAITELNMLHCTACAEEFAANNLIYLGTYSTTPYVLIGKGPMESFKAFRGLKVRSAGSLWDRWIRRMGGIAVNLPATDIAEAMRDGRIDAAIQGLAALGSETPWDVVRRVTPLPLGAYRSTSLFSFNRDAWGKLTAAQRSALLRAAPEGIIATNFAYLEQDGEVRQAAVAKGVAFAEPGRALVRSLEKFVHDDLEIVAELARAKYGIADPETVIAKYRKLYAKYERLMAPVGDNRDALVAVLLGEIFEKVDPAKYGL